MGASSSGHWRPFHAPTLPVACLPPTPLPCLRPPPARPTPPPPQYVDRDFLGDLAKAADPDSRAVLTRIQTYLKAGRFRSPPEGREMPQTDTSSYDRA